MEVRPGANPADVKNYDTDRLRHDFLIQNLFVADEIKTIYSQIDRIIVGAATPVNKELVLEAGAELRAKYFLERREMGIINIEELFKEIWDMDSIGDIATVTVHIKKIREKIELDTSKPQYIETIWGVGYRFKL